MRVILVDNLLFEDTEGIRRYVLQPHLGLISLIAVIRAGGHEAKLFDPKVEIAKGTLRLDDSLYREMARQILSMKPDVVGMTSLGCNFICTVKVAEYLKRWSPSLPILLGGPHATVLDQVILRSFPVFDLIVRSEAERTILPLLERFPHLAFDGLAGLTHRRGGDICVETGDPLIDDLDTLPVPAYDSYPIGDLQLTSLRVEAGRGCPFQCTFCSTASFFGRKFRLKSAARLVRELDLLHESYGVSDFALTHDLFTVNRKKVLEFCDAVNDRGYTWKCSARVDCVDEELLARMSAAGCRSIYYGIEAGSERMQKVSKKHLDLALFNPILATTQATGMSATVSFITGYPEELESDQAATLDMIGTCFDRDSTPLNVQLHLLTPEPGTELLHQYRNVIAYDGHISDFNFPSLEPDDGHVIEHHPDVFINHHYFPSVMRRSRHIFVTTAYQAIHSLGFPLLRYILKRFDGRLSSLIDAVEKHSQQTTRDPVCTHETLSDFFVEAFGARHHLTGLVRYVLKAAELRRKASLGPSETANAIFVDDPGRYRLSRRAFVLKNLPDCPTILDHLSRNRRETMPTPLLRGRYNFLVWLPPGQTDLVENFVLNEASASLLEYLSLDDLSSRRLNSFAEDTGYPVPPSQFFEVLAEKGWLEVDAGSA